MAAAGVAACWRGFRLWDDDASAALVKAWVAWHRKYRAMLARDIVHIQRPDGQQVDGYAHVDPAGSDGGLRASHSNKVRLRFKERTSRMVIREEG